MKLQRIYGEKRGRAVGKVYGTISGTLESIILTGLWLSPQPTFIIPTFSDLTVSIANLSIPILHLIVSLPLIAVGAFFGIDGVRRTGFETAETHSSPTKIVRTGTYSIVRHPQYFGWILAHTGISILLSTWYSMLFTPALLALIYLISKKEEDELIKEFGQEYEKYRKEVLMLFPRWKRRLF